MKRPRTETEIMRLAIIMVEALEALSEPAVTERTLEYMTDRLISHAIKQRDFHRETVAEIEQWLKEAYRHLETCPHHSQEALLLEGEVKP